MKKLKKGEYSYKIYYISKKMGIIISVLVYAIITFFAYSMIENENKIGTFIINLVGLTIWFLINNGTNFFILIIFSVIINGIIFTYIGFFVYDKQQELSKFLGTTVLLELITVIIVNFIFNLIYHAVY